MNQDSGEVLLTLELPRFANPWSTWSLASFVFAPHLLFALPPCVFNFPTSLLPPGFGNLHHAAPANPLGTLKSYVACSSQWHWFGGLPGS